METTFTELVYLYHSGYALLFKDFTVIIDFFEDSESETEGCVHNELLARPGRLYVLSSHFHADHFNPSIMEWKNRKEDITYILSNDIRRRRRLGNDAATWLKKGDSFSDENLTVRAFGSTDSGVSFLIETDGLKIFHAGDLNNWHWMDESEEKEWRGYEKQYMHELDDIAHYTDHMHLVMFPVDPRLGKEYMRGAKQFAERIHTSVFMPMHFDGNYDAANAFQQYAVEHNIKSPLLRTRGQRFKNLLSI